MMKKKYNVDQLFVLVVYCYSRVWAPVFLFSLSSTMIKQRSVPGRVAQHGQYFRVLKNRPLHSSSNFRSALCVFKCMYQQFGSFECAQYIKLGVQKYSQSLHGKYFQFQAWKIVVWKTEKVTHMRIPTVKNNQCCRIRMNQFIVKT